MKESLSVFSFERDSRPSVARSWTLVEEEKEFAGQSIGYCFIDYMARLGFVFLNGSLTLCYLYRDSGSKNRPKILARRHCRGRENFVFWFGAQFNLTLNFTQSGWPILFSPDLSFPVSKLGKLPNPLSLAGQRRPVQTSHWGLF